MKKEWVLVIICIVMVYACKQAKQPNREDKWALLRKPYAFFNQHNDSAFYYFNQAASHSRDSMGIATAYCYMGIIQSYAGDYYGAQESLSISLKFLNDKDAKDYDLLARDYNELGITVSDLKEYDEAIKLYDQALRFTNDNSTITAILNNKGNAYKEKGKYELALKNYLEAISKAIDSQNYSRTLTNMAITKWLYHSDYNAEPELAKALYIRKKENDFLGQSSSYDCLAKFYTHLHPDSALFYAKKMYNISRQINSPSDKLQALQLLIKLGPAKDARDYFKQYQQLNDSIQTARNTAKNQFALIRYEVEKNKADNLKLQKDISEEKYNLIKQKILLYSVVFILIGGGIFAVIWYKKRTERLKMEAENAIRESEIKTSKKVHDVVANGLYRIMAELEHSEVMYKDNLLDQVEELYNRSRDISYEKPALFDEEFQQTIAKMLTAFATTNTRVLLVGNSNALWEKVSRPIKHELGYILQELMVNMKKHSRASDVVIKFEEADGRLSVYYTDNGIGFPQNVQYGNGLTNTGTRIAGRHGTITFDNELKKGLKIHISFPIV